MTFKRHAMGPVGERPVSVQFEADFHQLLRPALIECAQKGNKKREGYIMGAFREALANYRVKTPEQTARSVELTHEEANAIYNIASTLQKVAQEREAAADFPWDKDRARLDVETYTSLKLKMMVLMLMEVGNDVSGV